MKILALDSSGLVASVAYLEDEVIKGVLSVNYQKTHSQTLLPMLDELVKTLNIDLNGIDYIAVSNGPGSFTGLRIGVATVKGLGLSIKKQIVGVSTLEALALNWQGVEGIVCPIMDARRNQVYTAAYKYTDNLPQSDEIIGPSSMEIDELVSKLDELGLKVFFTGDGVPVYKEYIEKNLKVPFAFPTASNGYQNAANVAILGEYYAKKGEAVDAALLSPVYLRKPQAEREREAMLNDQNS